MEVLTRLYIAICNGFYNFLHDEDGAADIVAVVLLIAAAVVLAIFFRKQIQDLLDGLIQNIGMKANEVMN